MQGNGAFPAGMYYRMGIKMELDLVFTRESTNAHELILELLIKSLVDLMDLGVSGTVAGLAVAAVVETGAGCVPGHLTMMAQFIFTTVSFSFEGKPRMVGPRVSITYQYKLTL